MMAYAELAQQGYNFFTGVPDSLLKDLIRSIEASSAKHIIATHESEAIGIAVGAELAGQKSCVYLQNSGLGNIIKRGVNMVIYANQLLRSAYPAMVSTAENILHHGRAYESKDQCMGIKDILNLIADHAD